MQKSAETDNVTVGVLHFKHIVRNGNLIQLQGELNWVLCLQFFSLLFKESFDLCIFISMYFRALFYV